MKKLSYLIVLALILGLILTGCTLLSNIGQTPATEQSGISGIVKSPVFPVEYGEVTIEDWGSGNFSDVWDLTQCDLTLSYTIDMSGITSAGWVLTEVGLREVGAPNIDPNYKGGFLLSKYAYATSNDELANLNDYHVLMKHGWSEEYYDREGVFPGTVMSDIIPGTYINYAFWFDRDGVDPDQATYWNYKDGYTYNTEGIYDVVIQYYALDNANGVMYATINDQQQGFYIPEYSSTDPPAMMPVGRTFTGDMTKMQVFYGRNGGGGTVTISDITVNGCPFWDECTVDLIAGQNEVAGMVTVDDDGDNLLITYETTGDWEITKTHLYVGKTDPKLLTSAPGQFPYSAEHNPAVTAYTYTIPIAEIDSYGLNKGKKWIADGDLGVVPGDQIYIAAHAEVEKITEFAPRYPSVVVSFNQGLRKNGTAVREGRSNPLQGLVYEEDNVETNFFSLGFGGDIIVEFDCPIPNGEGDDLRIIEDTWGSYPLETAEVYASQNGSTWVPLGEANNTLREDGDNFHSFSAFDLGSLEWAKYIKVVDTTNPDIHGKTADGFDLNAVEALQDCVQEETAWAEGDLIRPEKNWATYFEYPCLND